MNRDRVEYYLKYETYFSYEVFQVKLTPAAVLVDRFPADYRLILKFLSVINVLFEAATIRLCYYLDLNILNQLN